MTEEFQLNDDTYTGTKEVSENLKFESKLLQEWINDNVKDSGNIEKIEQFKGGQSNPTYKISTENNAYVLRSKPPGKLLPKAHAVDREYKVITALYETDVPVPKTYGLCEDDSVVGTPFFLMEYVDGTVYWDHMLPKCSPEERALIYKNKNKVIAKLHSVDYKKIGLEDYGKPGNYVARQVSRWSKQYRASETDNIEAMNNLIDWLPKNIPDDDETTIVHGDYRLDNMILKNNEVVGILDWELSTLGHPIADFSYHCLSWRTQEAFWDEAKLKELGIPSEKEYMEMYCENSGKDLSKNWEFYMAFNMFKIAGILQGILGRVRDGTAASKHAEERGNMVFPLSEAAWSTIEENFLK